MVALGGGAVSEERGTPVGGVYCSTQFNTLLGKFPPPLPCGAGASPLHLEALQERSTLTPRPLLLDIAAGHHVGMAHLKRLEVVSLSLMVYLALS